MSHPESLSDSTTWRKSMLFCQDCEHKSPVPVEGDWQIDQHAPETSLKEVAYRCPDCGTVLAVRPSERTVQDGCSDETVPVGLWQFSAALPVCGAVMISETWRSLGEWMDYWWIPTRE
jgi:hypothetical protein